MTDDSRLGDYEGFVRPSWTSEERENLGVVARFLLGIRAHEFDRVLADYSDHPYVQHNLSMKNGVDGVVEEGRKISKRFPEFSIEAKHVYADGDFVIIHSHMTAKASHRGNDRKGLNVFDTWKVVDGKIVEHWDSIQPLDFIGRLFSLLTGGKVRNSNGAF